MCPPSGRLQGSVVGPAMVDPSERPQPELPRYMRPCSQACECGQDRDEAEGFQGIRRRTEQTKSPRGDGHDVAPDGCYETCDVSRSRDQKENDWAQCGY